MRHSGSTVKCAVVRDRSGEAPSHALRIDAGWRESTVGKPLQWDTSLFDWRQDIWRAMQVHAVFAQLFAVVGIMRESHIDTGFHAATTQYINSARGHDAADQDLRGGFDSQMHQPPPPIPVLRHLGNRRKRDQALELMPPARQKSGSSAIMDLPVCRMLVPSACGPCRFAFMPSSRKRQVVRRRCTTLTDQAPPSACTALQNRGMTRFRPCVCSPKRRHGESGS